MQLREVVRRVLSEERNTNPEGGHYTSPNIPPAIWLAKTTTVHTSGTSKPIQFYKGAHPSTVVTSTSTVNAYNYFGTVAQGNWVMASKVNGGWVLIAGDPCST